MYTAMVAGMTMPRTPSAMCLPLSTSSAASHVLQAAVGAAADDHLVDFDLLALAGQVGVLRQVRVADGGLQSGQVDLNGLFVYGVRVGFVIRRLRRWLRPLR